MNHEHSAEGIPFLKRSLSRHSRGVAQDRQKVRLHQQAAPPEMIHPSLTSLRRAALHPATLSAVGRLGVGVARRVLADAPLPPVVRMAARTGLAATEFAIAEYIRRRRAGRL
jgi:hypothetical protein